MLFPSGGIGGDAKIVAGLKQNDIIPALNISNHQAIEGDGLHTEVQGLSGIAGVVQVESGGAVTGYRDIGSPPKGVIQIIDIHTGQAVVAGNIQDLQVGQSAQRGELGDAIAGKVQAGECH